jgi:hypothetical protein
MIRLLLILILAGLVALSAAWIADHDAVMIVTAGSYEIRTTVAIATGLLLVLYAVLWLFLRILFALFTALSRAGGSLSGKHRPPVPPPPQAAASAPQIPRAEPRLPS